MRILVVEPERRPHTEELDGTIESMREIVGGNLQAMYLSADIAIVFNDDAKAQHLPPNREVLDKDGCNDILHGTFFICGAPADSNRFASLPEEQLLYYLELFARPEAFLNLGGRTIVLPCEKGDSISIALCETE